MGYIGSLANGSGHSNNGQEVTSQSPLLLWPVSYLLNFTNN
jgi:hypothetical protein